MPGSSQINPAHLPELVEALPGIEALRGIAEIVPAYLVGGAVRDLLLGIEGAPTSTSRSRARSRPMAERSGGEIDRARPFRDRGRVERRTGTKIDIARARAESYARSGALPKVRPATIAEDLASRDFTINAMAVPLRRGRRSCSIHTAGSTTSGPDCCGCSTSAPSPTTRPGRCGPRATRPARDRAGARHRAAAARRRPGDRLRRPRPGELSGSRRRRSRQGARR